MSRLTLHHLQIMKQNQEKITVLTVYDASFARLASKQGVEIVFVGDSLGMVIQGKSTTIPVDISQLCYHTECVARGNINSIVMADLPFMSCYSPEEAMSNAKKLMQSGAEIVKAEGGAWLCDTVRLLTDRGVPVCAHIGLTPQYIHLMGGFRIQGREEKQAQQLLQDAVSLQQAGAQLLVVECMPHYLAEEITQTLQIPVIGIGAGSACDGQVLVIYDILGLTPGEPLRFTKNFLEGCTDGISGAISQYINAVKEGEFPAVENVFV